MNGERADDYHRLDLRVARSFGAGKRVQGSFFFDLVNAYARNSGGAAQYKPEAGSSEYELEQSDSLPILVSVGVKSILLSTLSLTGLVQRRFGIYSRCLLAKRISR